VAGSSLDVTVNVVVPRPPGVSPPALETFPDNTVADTGLTLLVAGCSKYRCRAGECGPAYAGVIASPVSNTAAVAGASARAIQPFRGFIMAAPFIGYLL
jgi:hypothetical protein